ncbi:MAG TPA: hypothetical protein VIL41_00610 [Coriobacteriia bacterium]
MPTSLTVRRVSQLAATSLLAVALTAALAGCGSAGSTTGGSPSSGPSTSATSTGTPQTLTFDLAASRAGRPRTTAESTLTISWFPPGGVTGLEQLIDTKRIAELAHAASGNGQFWIDRPKDHAEPIVFGSEAVSLLATSTGFSTALIVPVRDVAAPKSVTSQELAADPKGTPVSYEVLLAGDVGETSFGLRKGTKPGQWLLDPNGELVNWGNSIDAVGRKAGFVAEQAFVTHTAFDLGGRAAVYLTWAVFRDAKGKELAVVLHNPPPIKATWAIAGGQPLHIATVYEPGTAFGPVVLTPTN